MGRGIVRRCVLVFLRLTTSEISRMSVLAEAFPTLRLPRGFSHMAFVDKYAAEIIRLQVVLYHTRARLEARTDSEALHDL